MSKSVERRLAVQMEAPKRSKYNAKKTERDGIVFDSKAEADRYADLKLMAKAGAITDLQFQPRFTLLEGFTRDGKKIRPIEYVADFAYIEADKIVVEDVKGGKATMTEAYKLKRKLFLYRFPEIDFREIVTERKGKRA